MKRRIEQLINGRFEYEVPSLMVSRKDIVETTEAGENIRGELIIAADNGSRIKGIAYSSHRRFLLGKERFSGSRAEIPYGADVKGMKPGESFSGELILSTNIGEYKIPFEIGVEDYQIHTADGSIKNLEDFTKLAKEDFKEAYHLFLDREFPEILTEDRRQIPFYYAMTQNPVTWQHLEEFLIGTGSKEPVTITMDKDHVEVYNVENSLMDTIRIRRSGWGYFKGEIQVEGNFLEVEKNLIGEEDFIGSICDIPYIIRKEKLGSGKNFGAIRIKTVYETLEYQVMASQNGKIRVNVDAYAKSKKLELLRLLLNYGTKNITEEEWKRETEDLLEEIRESGYFTTEYELFEAWYFCECGRKDKAQKILSELEENSSVFADEEMEGAFLYISDRAGCSRDIQEMTDLRLNQLYQRKDNSFLLLYFVIRFGSNAIKTQAKKMYLLEELYGKGCRSPFLYLEACRTAEEDGTLLRRINGFTIQIFLFARRYHMMTEELAFRAADLAIQGREFNRKLYEILEYIYEKYPSAMVIKAICTLIMKGNPRDKEYFRWYELAVEKDIKITRLYEYYIETMSSNYNKLLPKMIRMYFAYNNTLSDSRKAFIYSNVIRNKEIDKATYMNYRAAMEEFAALKLKEGRINEDFAVVYQEFCLRSNEESVKRGLAKILFTHRLYCDDPKIRRVIVRHAAFKEEQVYSFQDKTAYISIYSPDACIIFEDDRQRRYIRTVDYNIKPLFEQKELAEKLLEEGIRTPGLLLYTCGELDHENPVTEENLLYMKDAPDETSFSEEYRYKIRKRLLLYYEEHMDAYNLKEYLRDMDFHSFAKVNKSLLITILIKQKLFVGAYDLLCEYGYEGVSADDLLKLCRHMILNLEFEYEEEILLMSYYVYKENTFDEVILDYLVRYYEGPVNEMYQLWEHAMGFSMEAYELEEKILVYSMFTRIYDPDTGKVLKEYSRAGGKEEVILAYLTFASYEYFIGEKETDRLVFRALERIRKNKWEHDVICDLALLKFYGKDDRWTEERMETARDILSVCSRSGYKFAFYQDLPRKLLQSTQLDDKIFAQYQGSPCAEVTIFYRRIRNGQEPEEFHGEPLKNRYQGIFNKEFILLYGEELEYYFVVRNNGDTRTTEKQKLKVSNTKLEGNTKYQLLNRMLEAKQRRNEREFHKILLQYRWQDTCISNFIGLIE